MIISITDKITNFVKYYYNKLFIATKELISSIFDIITSLGFIISMLISLINSSILSFIISLILFFLFFKRDLNSIICMTLVLIIAICII